LTESTFQKQKAGGPTFFQSVYIGAVDVRLFQKYDCGEDRDGKYQLRRKNRGRNQQDIHEKLQELRTKLDSKSRDMGAFLLPTGTDIIISISFFYKDLQMISPSA